MSTISAVIELCLLEKIQHRSRVIVQSGWIYTIRHNDILNVTSDFLSVVCKDVEKEPTLDSSPAGTEKFREDIVARGFWQRMQRVFTDVKVFYPLAPSYQS